MPIEAEIDDYKTVIAIGYPDWEPWQRDLLYAIVTQHLDYDGILARIPLRGEEAKGDAWEDFQRKLKPLGWVRTSGGRAGWKAARKRTVGTGHCPTPLWRAACEAARIRVARTDTAYQVMASLLEYLRSKLRDPAPIRAKWPDLAWYSLSLVSSPYDHLHVLHVRIELRDHGTDWCEGMWRAWDLDLERYYPKRTNISFCLGDGALRTYTNDDEIPHTTTVQYLSDPGTDIRHWALRQVLERTGDAQKAINKELDWMANTLGELMIDCPDCGPEGECEDDDCEGCDGCIPVCQYLRNRVL